ncbi:MAG: YbaB/EbfC family nucleoid-associated protein [Dehalococcoidia bacterium]|nr:YbaB/EbfC family nucleoid-associated protein [Dehalococcoidia bacterium]
MNKRFLKQAQQLQRQMARVQEDLEAATVEGSAGGGVVRAVVTGKMRLESIHIDPDAAAEDVAMLEDLVAAAVNDALERAQEMAAARMGALTGGLNIPGLT